VVDLPQPALTATDTTDDEASESIKKKSQPPQKHEKNRVLEIPESLRFDPKSMENKPKGLVDSLTKYFTPGKNKLDFVYCF
jgi:hypothetical protein